MREVADHVARAVRSGDQVVLVVSAMGKETDDLLRLAGEVSAVHPGREMDMLVTAGERKAMGLVCMALHDSGIDSESFTGSDEHVHLAARVNGRYLTGQAQQVVGLLAHG